MSVDVLNGPFTTGLMDHTDDRMMGWNEQVGDPLGEPESWQLSGLCAQVDPEIFYPEKGGSSLGAKRVCARCTVRPECLEYALDTDERFGVWGGLSERERSKLKRMRRG